MTTNINDSYMWSGINIINAITEFGKQNFTKEILFVFDNKQEMLDKELELVNTNFISNQNNYNIILGDGGFNRHTVVTVKDKNGFTYSVHKTDIKYLSVELKHICTGKVTVKDMDGNISQVNIDNQKYISGELVGATIGKIMVRYKEGDERYLSGKVFKKKT